MGSMPTPVATQDFHAASPRDWGSCGLFCLIAVAVALGDTIETADGLRVTFDSSNGVITQIAVEDANVPLLPAQPGGVSLSIGSPISPYPLTQFDFNLDDGEWTDARNSDWDGAGAFTTWLAAGGVGNSGHLLLGDGATEGAGMAIPSIFPVTEGHVLRITWQARTASIETTQIANVRVYDAQGFDITQSTPAPSGWAWTGASQAHAWWGIHNTEPDVWETFSATYAVPAGAAFARVSIRHWTGGDHWVHLDDLAIDVVGGIVWSEETAVLGPTAPTADGIAQSVTLPALDVQVDTITSVSQRSIKIEIDVQDLAAPMADRPILLHWTLPIAAEGWTWWDDIGVAQTVQADWVTPNTFGMANHAASLYPLCSVTNETIGMSLAVPMDEPVVQRFECGGAVGLRSTWELCLSPDTINYGPGRARVSLEIYHNDSAWGFRSAVSKYHALYPQDFAKRTRREGAWQYPIVPSLIPDPVDFGFAFFETRPLTESERALCGQLDIGIFHYVEPWLAWQYWGSDPNKPSYEDRVARMESWAAGGGALATWQPDGGMADSGHLLLGDGVATGAGMATDAPFAIDGGETVTIDWWARVADTETLQILCVRLYDGAGADITQQHPAPARWFFSSGSQAHTVAGIANTAMDTWQHFEETYAIPVEAEQMRVSLRYWNSGDHLVHADTLRVVRNDGETTYLQLDFDEPNGPWVSAYNADWEDAGPTWLQSPRSLAAETVLNASPMDEDGQYLIDWHSYFWHEWSPGSWNQAWPMNPDPALPSPNAYELYREYWIQSRLDEAAGIYFDSVAAEGAVAGWANHRAEHIAVAAGPVTFSWTDGAATQIATQTHAAFFDPIVAELHAQGKLSMLNLFTEGSRYDARFGDTMGSEVFQLVEEDWRSRVRRTLASRRIVSNLLQWGWDSPEYITYEEMEEFIRGQLFWGFYPAVSSAGGMLDGGTPDRYFLHPELYERDRPLFQHYIPAIRLLSTAGWEAVTGATSWPPADMERFGDFRRDVVYLTVRSEDGSELQTEITVDLAECGLGDVNWPLDARDVLNDEMLIVDPNGFGFARLDISLAAGEVGVFALTPAAFPAGDVTRDGVFDVADLNLLDLSMAGPGAWPDPPPPLSPQQSVDAFDKDQDFDVDMRDVAAFQTSFQ